MLTFFFVIMILSFVICAIGGIYKNKAVSEIFGGIFFILMLPVIIRLAFNA